LKGNVFEVMSELKGLKEIAYEQFVSGHIEVNGKVIEKKYKTMERVISKRDYFIFFGLLRNTGYVFSEETE
jgi:hypothetical protein